MWFAGAAEPGGRRRRARLLPAKGTFSKSQKQKINWGLEFIRITHNWKSKVKNWFFI